jgi:DnaJ-class molecular chaperone
MIIECKNCGGKGHVYDACSAMLFVVGWVAAIFERNNPNGLTREKCSVCNGKGYRKIKDK